MLQSFGKAVAFLAVGLVAAPAGAQVYRSAATAADWPEEVQCGESFVVNVKVSNLSRTPWTEADFHKLGPVLGEDEPFRRDGHRFKMPDGTTVPFAGHHVFALELTAPDEGGSYETQWSMMTKGVAYGVPIKKTIRVVCDNASLGRAVIPRKVACGETFEVQVRMKNEGKSTWTEARFYKLGPVLGENEPFRPDGKKMKMPDGTEVVPGEIYPFEFKLTAPEKPGRYETQWIMMQGGKPFGEEISRSIEVECKKVKKLGP